MSEQFPKSKDEVYDEEGRVKDPGIANEMAHAENPFYKKILGVFQPSKKTLEKGERLAEEQLESILQENIDNERADAEIEALLPRFQKIRELISKNFPGYARYREQRWNTLYEHIENKNKIKNRQVLLGYLIREIEMHEEWLKRDLNNRTINEFVNSELDEKEKGH